MPAARVDDRGGDVMRGVMSEVEDRSPERPAFAAMDGVSKKPGRHDPPHRGAAREEPTQRWVLQITTWVPSSTSRLPGMWKNSVAGVALRDMKRNSLSRHSAMPCPGRALSDSRLAK